MAVSVAVIIGSFILTTFGQSVDWLEAYQWLSLLQYFPAVDIAKDGIDWGNVGVLGGLSVLLLIVATALFRRRDTN